MAIKGTNGIDILNGTTVRDYIYGYDGNDIIDGGEGMDYMYGGKGDDIFYVDNKNDRVMENEGEGIDTVYSSVTYYLGTHSEIMILTGTDNIDAYGSSRDDALYGNSGNNIINGRGGADKMYGGLGDDTYYIDNIGDEVFENPDEGIDTVNSSFTHILADNFENLTLTGSDNIDGIGNNLDNFILGNSGDNTLYGGDGNDTFFQCDNWNFVEKIWGGGGTDTVYGGKGNDVYLIDSAEDQIIEYSNEGIDSVYSRITYKLPDNVERLYLVIRGDKDAYGNDLDNIINGNCWNNKIYGYDGDDIIYGAKGNDIIDGGPGADRMVGGEANDTFYVDNVNDKVEESANQGNDTVYSSVSYTITRNIEKLVLTGSDDIMASCIGDTSHTLIGNDGNNIIDGGVGSDILMGGKGDDTYLTFMSRFGFGNDRINDVAGNDTLDCKSFNSSAASFSSLDLNSDGKIDALKLDLGNYGSMQIEHYFNNASSNISNCNPGAGCIENILFADTTLSFADIQNIA